MKNHFGALTIPLSVRPVIPIQRPEAICSWSNVLRNHWRNRRNERPPNERFAAFAVPPETRIEAASLCDSMRPCFRAATFFPSHVVPRLDNYIHELFFCLSFSLRRGLHVTLCRRWLPKKSITKIRVTEEIVRFSKSLETSN